MLAVEVRDLLTDVMHLTLQPAHPPLQLLTLATNLRELLLLCAKLAVSLVLCL
jgi:hypothetical protein